MTEIDQVIEVSIRPESLREIEKFVDRLCEQLSVNETYYGNILMGVSETFSLCLKSKYKTTLKISYKTDYQSVIVILKPVDKKAIAALKKNPELEDIEGDEMLKHSFLVNSLTEKVEILNDNELHLVFDISAMHDKISKLRQKKLDDYFEQTLTKALRKKKE